MLPNNATDPSHLIKMQVRPVTTYLDTQDFSNFADYMAGRGRPGLNKTFESLAKLRDERMVVFPVSLPIISELLQYDGGGRSLTLHKAKAAAELSQGWAVRDPNTIIATEIAQAAYERGLARKLQELRPIGPDIPWSPSLGLIGGHGPDLLANAVSTALQNRPELDQLPRPTRRNLKRRAAEAVTKNLGNVVAESPLKDYPVSSDFIAVTFSKYLRGRLSRADFQRALEKELNDITQFVELYFEKFDGSKELPGWMRSFGDSLMLALSPMRNETITIEKDLARKTLSDIFESSSHELYEMLCQRLKEEIVCAGLSEKECERLAFSSDLTTEIPFFKMMKKLVPAYFAENIGLGVNPRKPRVSDGGDIMHAIYTPYVDVWRGDAYFSNLLKSAVGNGAALIVSRIEELPDAIETKFAANQILAAESAQRRSERHFRESRQRRRR